MTLMKNNRWPHQSTRMAQPEGLRLECASTHTIPHLGCVLASVHSTEQAGQYPTVTPPGRSRFPGENKQNDRRSTYFSDRNPAHWSPTLISASKNRVRRKIWFHRWCAPSLDGSQSLQLDAARHISGYCFFSLP